MADFKGSKGLLKALCILHKELSHPSWKVPLHFVKHFASVINGHSFDGRGENRGSWLSQGLNQGAWLELQVLGELSPQPSHTV